MPAPLPDPSTPQNPDANDSSQAPCGICDRNVGWAPDRGVACETCGLWFHATCMNIGSQTYLKLDDTEVSWHCDVCKSLNYSTVAYDLHGIEQESANTPSSLPHFSFHSSDTFSPNHCSTPTRQRQQNKNENRPLRIVNINFRSAVGKAPGIHHMVQSLKPDIIIGTETWCDSTIKSAEFLPPGYKIFRRDRNRLGGGILLAISDSLVCTEEPHLSKTDCEILWIKVKLKYRRDLLIGAYYRNDVSNESSFRSMAESLRLACNSQNAIIVLGGDLNFPGFDWKEKRIKPNSSYIELHKDFLNLLADLGLEQLIENPTHISGNTLDLIITSHPNCFPRTEIAPGLSDHAIVYAELLIQPSRVRLVDRTVPQYRKADWDGLRSATSTLSSKILEEFSSSDNVETIWSTMKSGLCEIIQKFIPHKKLRPKRDQEWIDHKTLKLILEETGYIKRNSELAEKT